jgi:hypothetical protein
MTVSDWLENAIRDADARGLGSLRSSLQALAQATLALRRADWNADAAARTPETHDRPSPPSPSHV